MLPSNKEWSMIRREVQRFMPDTVSIYSISTSYSSETGESKVRTLVSTNKARFGNPSGNERQLIQALVNSGVEDIETAKLHLPFDTDISVSNEVLTEDGKYWNVVHTNSSQSFTSETNALLYRRVVNTQVVN